MNTIIKLTGYEFPDPDASTVPDIRRVVGPLDVKEADAWLTQSGFTEKPGRQWVRGKGVFQRKRADSKEMINMDVACVFAEVVIVDPMEDVIISD